MKWVAIILITVCTGCSFGKEMERRTLEVTELVKIDTIWHPREDAIRLIWKITVQGREIRYVYSDAPYRHGYKVGYRTTSLER